MKLLLYLVTVDASDATRFVRAALPEKMRATGMTIDANGVLLGNGVGRIFAEANGDRVFAAACFDVSAAGAMAAFAATSLFR